MTELYSEAAPDSDDFLINWLQPLLPAALERDTDEELPFAVVQLIVGTDDPDEGSCDDIVQIDLFVGADTSGPSSPEKLAPAQAKMWAKKVHRRINFLRQNQDPVVLSDGTIIGPDFVRVTQRFRREPYKDDNIVRLVGRYRIGLSFVAA